MEATTILTRGAADRLSTRQDGPAHVTLNVFPTTRGTTAVFSFLREDRPQALEAFGRIFAATGLYQQYELSKLILRRCENIVIAPAHYARFGHTQRWAIAEFFQRTVLGQAHDVEDHRIFLFAAYED